MNRVIAAAIAEAVPALAPVSDTARLDAELLMAHALGVKREAMLLGQGGSSVPAKFAALVARRRTAEPVAYIVGHRAFWTIELAVRPGVLVPRADSETLIEAAAAHFTGGPGPSRILDLGTGSGALLLAALDEWPHARGIGVDISPEALAVARENAERLGLARRAEIVAGSWGSETGPFDLILCNPPYIVADTPLPDEVVRHEPAGALFGGADGLDCYRAIAPALGERLAPDGLAAIEIGHDQGVTAAALFRAGGMAVKVRQDLGRRDRCLLVTHG